MNEADIQAWLQRLAEVTPPRNRAQSERFCEVVEQAEGALDPRIVSALFNLLAQDIDTSLLQTVSRVMESLPLDLYYAALLDVITRIPEPKGLDESFAAHPGKPIRGRDLPAIAALVRLATPQARERFLDILDRRDFRSDNVWAARLSELIETRE